MCASCALTGCPSCLRPTTSRSLRWPRLDCSPMHSGCSPPSPRRHPVHPGEGLRGAVPRQRGDAVRRRARHGRQGGGPHAVRPGDAGGGSRGLPVSASSAHPARHGAPLYEALTPAPLILGKDVLSRVYGLTSFRLILISLAQVSDSESSCRN